MTTYKIIRKDDGIWLSVEGDPTLSLIKLGPVEDAEAIMQAMADWLGEEDFGDAAN